MRILFSSIFAAMALLPATAQAAVSFDHVVLDESYIAYQRGVGDIDGDGRNDVAAVMEGDTTVQLFRAPAWKRSTLIVFTGEYRYPRADDFMLVDMDGDGDMDVTTRLGRGPSDDGPGIAVWCENLGHGTHFLQRLIGNSPEYVKDFVVADFDRDGRPDVAMRMDRKTQLWLQDAGGTWTEVVLSHPPHEGMEAGDLDMDDDPDLILNGFWFETPNTPVAARMATNYQYHVIDAAWHNQTGDWTANSCKVVGGDFDGDGRCDVAFSHSERAGFAVAWYRSPTPRTGNTWSKYPVAVVDFCHTLQAADFDGDGRTDMLAGGMIQSQHRGLRLLRNLGRGTNWTEWVIQTNGSYSAEIGDLDNDGDWDIVGIRNWNSAPTWIYRNHTRHARLDRWTYDQVSAAHVPTFGLCFPDIEGDSDLDLISIAYDDFTKLHLWRNDSRQREAKVVSSSESPWGVVRATLGDGPERDGTILLENQSIRIRYNAKRFADGNKDHVITDFLVKKSGGQLAIGDQLDGIWMNADEGRGQITSASVAFDSAERKTLHVEWDNGKVIQEFTLWPERPVVRIDYLKCGINIVDMVSSVDSFEVYGAKAWQVTRAKVTNTALLNHPNPHHRLTKELYPKYPFPLVAGKDWEKLEIADLTYHHHFILGAYNRETGLGFGRVYPAQDANYIKLLNTGFEVFPNWQQSQRRFSSYLYAVTDGSEELLSAGMAVADSEHRFDGPARSPEKSSAR
jgi:hypothetical protein